MGIWGKFEKVEKEENLFLCQSRSNFEINANLNCCQCSVSCNGENERDSLKLLTKILLNCVNILGIHQIC